MRVLSMPALRRAVLRDLEWLFNTTSLSVFLNLERYPLVSQSIINYGMPNFSGKTASGLDVANVERWMRQVIWEFEPRILRHTVQVKAVPAEEVDGHPNLIVFEISGDLWGQHLPEHLYLKSEVNLEIGEIRVYESDGRIS